MPPKPAAKKPAAKKPAAKPAKTKKAAAKPAVKAKAAVKKAAPVKKAAKPAAKKAAPKPAPAKPAAEQPAAKTYGQRTDLGAPIDGFLAEQPPTIRAILDALRAIVTDVAPDAAGALKWGMPVFTIDDAMMCALRAERAYVRLVLSGPPDIFADPDEQLEGEGKTGRHLKIASVETIPHDAVRAWLLTAAAHARA